MKKNISKFAAVVAIVAAVVVLFAAPKAEALVVKTGTMTLFTNGVPGGAIALTNSSPSASQALLVPPNTTVFLNPSFTTLGPGTFAGGGTTFIGFDVSGDGTNYTGGATNNAFANVNVFGAPSNVVASAGMVVNTSSNWQYLRFDFIVTTNAFTNLVIPYAFVQ
jgi:hypothetical protein